MAAPKWIAQHFASMPKGFYSYYESVVRLDDSSIFTQGANPIRRYARDRTMKKVEGVNSGYAIGTYKDRLYVLSCENFGSNARTAATRLSFKGEKLAQANVGPYVWGGLVVGPAGVVTFLDRGEVCLFDHNFNLKQKRVWPKVQGETVTNIALFGSRLVVGLHNGIEILALPSLETEVAFPHSPEAQEAKEFTVSTSFAEIPGGRPLIAAATNYGVLVLDDALQVVARAASPSIADRVYASPDGNWLMASKNGGAGKGLYAIALPESLRIPGTVLDKPLKHKKVKTEGKGAINLGCFWDDVTFVAGFPDTLDRVTLLAPGMTLEEVTEDVTRPKQNV